MMHRLALAYLKFGFVLVIASVHATDEIALPPASENYYSPASAYLLTLTMIGAPEDWAANGSEAVFKKIQNGQSEQLWSQQLPHSYRPKLVIVSDQGYLALFDQWINVLGPYAIMVFSPSGDRLKSLSFDDIAKSVEASRANVVKKAQIGSWMESLPRIAASSNIVEVAVAGKVLSIDLETGSLSQN